MKNKRPILVTGSHRSGTTWIGRTISQHPKVRYEHEPFNVSHPNKNMGLKLNTWFSHFQASNQKEEIYTAFNNLLKPSPLKYAVKVCKAAGMDIKIPMRFAKHLFLESFLRPRTLVKDPFALLSAGWLYATYNFMVIVMIRNPFAFVASSKVAHWDFNFRYLREQEGLMQGRLHQFADRAESMCNDKDYDLIDRTALLWNILHFVILEYQSKYPEWLFMTHEDISINPEERFRQVFDYLGLEMNSKILSYIEKYTSQKNPKEAPETSYQPRNSRLSLHTWKNRLSAEEIERVKIATSDIASKFYDKIV